MNDQPQPKCLSCGNTSDKAVLLDCVKDGDPNWVCVHCLPMLIHGAH
ncbi:MAG: hypothetical protein ACYCXF_04085 [Thermoleophilia bacterium]